MADRSLETEVQYLKGVGPKNAVPMKTLGLLTVEDVLFHLPRRYEDRRHLPPIGQVRPGQFVTIKGRLAHVDARPTRRGQVLLTAVVRDGTGNLALTWFNQPWIKRQLEGYRGEIIAYGQVKDNGRLYEIQSPEFEILTPEDDPAEFARIVAVYPSTEGLHQKTLRRAVRAAVEGYLTFVKDPLPETLRRAQRLPGLQWALRQVHFPENDQARQEGRRRLVFDEFLYMQLGLAMKRAEANEELGIAFPIDALLEGRAPALHSAPRAKPRKPAVAERRQVPGHLFSDESAANRDSEPLWDQIRRMLPFELTGAQRRVVEEIYRDMRRPHPMNRLVQGDVGSGKTAVAACAILAAVRSGYQAALMAPTEILAEQHYVNLRTLFEPLGIEVELLAGKLSAAQKKKAADNAKAGLTHVAVGTHALIQEGVGFANLGLVVIDEQHRFGVMQRLALREKALGNPDVLVMTATPIPRTLTMSIWGDLELSVIDELPPGRLPVKTHWKQPFEREQVYTAVRQLLDQGKQAYIVCPMVSESEKMMAQAAEDLFYRLNTGALQGCRLGLLHGQMRPKEKEDVMERFRRHELDALVSTTVIEVGVDVPNASVMIIEDANRFGLSQLHQLRGRVGRGGTKSYCVLIADAKTDDAQQRMEIMVATNDGFRIAEEDLRLRGPGEVAGTRQHGNLDLKIADLVQDAAMLEVAREVAIELIARDPKLELPEHRSMREKVLSQRSEAAVVTVS